VISIDENPATVRVLKTDEEAIIAQTAQRLVPQSGNAGV
jgi:acetate kinase